MAHRRTTHSAGLARKLFPCLGRALPTCAFSTSHSPLTSSRPIQSRIGKKKGLSKKRERERERKKGALCRHADALAIFCAFFLLLFLFLFPCFSLRAASWGGVEGCLLQEEGNDRGDGGGKVLTPRRKGQWVDCLTWFWWLLQSVGNDGKGCDSLGCIVHEQLTCVLRERPQAPAQRTTRAWAVAYRPLALASHQTLRGILGKDAS